MERKVNLLENSRVEVIVNVDVESWKAAQEKAFAKLAANVSVPGFRKGKAPLNMVRGKVDPAKIMDEAINSLLPVAYKDILDNEDIKPFGQPKVDVTNINENGIELKFEIVTMPKIKLREYKGLKIGKTVVEVTDKDVDDAIDALRVRNATVAVKEGEAAKGDIVVMDFTGRIDGVEFDGGKAENHELELGSGQFIPGFEDQLVGVKAGETRVVKVQFPENYTPELKGKDAEFECVVHEVKEKKLPELNDEFIADIKMPGVSTIDELKAKQKEEIQARKENDAKREYLNKVLDSVVAASEVSIPDEIVQNQANMHKQDMEKRMEQSGFTLEQYLQILGQSQEDFEAQLKADSKKEVANFLVLEAVAAAEKLEVSDEELDVEIAKIADQYKMSVEDVKKALSKQLEEFRHNIKMNKVEDLLYKNND
ncbi:MAG: trigger factor [Bacilli bacterium]|nr:trigger factor [Bacilli bacterium]